MSLFPKDPVLRTCLLYSTLVWCPCFQWIPFSEPVCYTQLLCVVFDSKGSHSQNLSVILNFCLGSLLPKDPVRSTCLLCSTLLWCPCGKRIPFSEPVCYYSTLVCCPCFQMIPFSEPVYYLQLLCFVLASKGSRSQNLSVIFNSCVVSLLLEDPVLRTCLLYSTLVWCPCFQKIPFSESVCYIQLLCGVIAS